MTREEKIEQIIVNISNSPNNFVDDLKAVILAGIALRDEELLAMEFDEVQFRRWKSQYGYSADANKKIEELNHLYKQAVDANKWLSSDYMNANKKIEELSKDLKLRGETTGNSTRLDLFLD
jgi:hypothetical protein